MTVPAVQIKGKVPPALAPPGERLSSVLVTLSVSNNALESVPAEFFRWRKLKNLDLSRNKCVHASVGGGDGMEGASRHRARPPFRALARSRVVRPHEIAHLCRRSHTHRLGLLPMDVAEVKSLELLDLSHNRLEEAGLPHSLWTLPKLISLNLAGKRVGPRPLSQSIVWPPRAGHVALLFCS